MVANSELLFHDKADERGPSLPLIAARMEELRRKLYAARSAAERLLISRRLDAVINRYYLAVQKLNEKIERPVCRRVRSGSIPRDIRRLVRKNRAGTGGGDFSERIVPGFSRHCFCYRLSLKNSRPQDKSVHQAGKQNQAEQIPAQEGVKIAPVPVFPHVKPVGN